MNTRLAILTGVLALFVSATALSQNYKHFPGPAVDQKTMRALERVEQLYERGDYARALFIYEKELAPVGDKYAQYMVGYMYLAGKSVPPNRPAALAWYRLAAERGEPAIVQARDALHNSMSPEEVEISNGLFADLWRRIGDNRLILDLISEDMQILRARTGTRIPGGTTGQLMMINMSGNGGAERFYKDVRERLQTRLEYLKTNVEIIDIEQDDEVTEVRSLEQEIRKELAALGMP
ncbi:MAG: hypothetical protein BMS9Abin32_589 [Gammaproteobacteria bacterium]|nr:MAG: hypothetical protein BMS9Abin32_589 [Gammaproteobacteria bacterium]